MNAALTFEPRRQTAVPTGPLTRLAQAIALLLAGWLIARRRFTLELSGRLEIGGAVGERPLGARTRRVHGDSLNVVGELPRALAAEEIILHYQPIIALGDGTIRGAEGLVRWEHPRHGLLGPAAFIQVLEQTGQIGQLTHHVIDQALAECAHWRDEGGEFSVAVNLSVRNLLDPELPADVERLLERHSLPADALQFEITERMVMSEAAVALATVTRLSDLGVQLSVDDFGTGYSSLANLRNLPVNQLKIDRSFVTQMLEDDSDLIIVRSTINMAHDLGLRIIAEGVEDGPTLIRLASLGADLAQGYHVSRPLSAAGFDDFRRRAARG